jgi:Uma2 family endonuclease
MSLPKRRDDHHYTYADYRAWPTDERWELIDGVAYAMGPAPLRLHQKVLFQLARQAADALEGKTGEAYIAPFDVRLPKGQEQDEALDTVVQPDLSVICDPTKLDDKGCRGAPDWIVEVLSPATASRDHLTKRALYERSGVREFWLVHPTDRIATIYRQAEPRRFGPAEFIELSGHTAVSILPEIVIDWARVVGDGEEPGTVPPAQT